MSLSQENQATQFDNLVQTAQGRPVPVFAGVGSRKTPPEVGLLMAAISRKLTESGWTLRSGAADGADLAFESGVAQDGKKEIYLPYPGFNGSTSSFKKFDEKCYQIASEVHPAWERCSEFARKAHARNANQVLGADLESPADMVICWTPDGAVDAASAKNAGGTRTAIVMAHKRGIPVYNLQRHETCMMFRQWAGEDLIADMGSVLKMEGKAKSGKLPNAPQPATSAQTSFLFRDSNESRKTVLLQPPEVHPAPADAVNPAGTGQDVARRPVFKFRTS